MRPGEWPSEDKAEGMKVPVKKFVENLDAKEAVGEKAAIEEVELPDVPERPDATPSVEPREDQPKDKYQWACDPNTFTYDRLIFGESVEDEATVNPKLKVRMRTLTARERVEVDSELSVAELRSRWVGTMNRHSLMVLSKMIVSVNGSPVGMNAEEVVTYLDGRPDTYVSLLSEVANEFTARVTRMAQRGDPKNC